MTKSGLAQEQCLSCEAMSSLIATIKNGFRGIQDGVFTPLEFASEIPDVQALVQAINETFAFLQQKKQHYEELSDLLLNAQMAAEHASNSKSRFLANMSHEIRTPINGIIGLARMIQDEGELKSKQQEHLDMLIESAGFLHGLVEDVLDLSKIEAGKLRLESSFFSLDELVQMVKNTVLFAARKKRIDLSIESDFQSDQLLSGDPLRIRQILINLLTNAIKFTPEGGKVTVKIRTIEKTDVSTAFRIEVQDTGIGMDEATRARLFRPFEQADASTTRKFGGTGLGLSICSSLVDLIGGAIGVESVIDQGSLFWFELPLLLGPSMEELLADTDQEQAGQTLTQMGQAQTVRVLMAEDHPVNQIVIKAILEKYHFKIDIVENGQKAIEAAKCGQYHLILMDCQMPEMDGFEATRRIRGLPNQTIARTPIIALTANTMTGDKESCLGAGMNGFIGKPIDVPVLEQELLKWLRVG